MCVNINIERFVRLINYVFWQDTSVVMINQLEPQSKSLEKVSRTELNRAFGLEMNLRGIWKISCNAIN